MKSFKKKWKTILMACAIPLMYAGIVHMIVDATLETERIRSQAKQKAAYLIKKPEIETFKHKGMSYKKIDDIILMGQAYTKPFRFENDPDAKCLETGLMDSYTVYYDKDGDGKLDPGQDKILRFYRHYPEPMEVLDSTKDLEKFQSIFKYKVELLKKAGLYK